MSCPESFTYAPRGRQGIGVIQPQSGLDYPLVAPSEDIRYLIADMYFEYDDPGLYLSGHAVAKHPLKIKWLYGVGCEENAAIEGMPTPTHDADILITDADDNVVFDSTNLGNEPGYQRATVKDWGADYKLYEWLSPAAVCRLVVYKNWAPDEANAVNYVKNLAPANATIDERAVYKMPKRVKSLRVLDTTIKRSPVAFKPGYNFSLPVGSQEIIGLRYQTPITFNVNPNNEYSDCNEEKPTYIYSINGVGADKFGDFFITAKDCVFARTPTERYVDLGVKEKLLNGDTGGLNINSDCPPCCSCQDYVNTALYMNNLRDKYARVGSRSHQVKLLHEDNIGRWLEQRTCRLNKPLRVSLSPLSCPYMEVIMQFCNQCPECVEDVVLSVTLSAAPPTAVGELVPGYTIINAPSMPNETFNVTGAWPTFSARLGFVDKGSSVFVRFLLKFTPRDYAYAITGVLTGTIKGEPIKPCDPNYGNDEISQSVDTRALYCNKDGCTDVFISTGEIVINFVNRNQQPDKTVIYTVAASATNGKDISYQWQISDDGKNWSNIFDADLAIAGAATSQLTVFNTYGLQYPGRQYRVNMTAENSIGNTHEFGFAPLGIKIGNVIVIDATRTTPIPGPSNIDTIYSVTARTISGAPIVGYEWQYSNGGGWIVAHDDGMFVSGSITPTLSLSFGYDYQKRWRVRMIPADSQPVTYTFPPA